jgi:hypothetical protein
VAAFYRLPRCLFYIVGGFHWGRFTIVFVRLPVRSEGKKIVDWMSEILFAAQIAFGRLHGHMPQQIAISPMEHRGGGQSITIFWHLLPRVFLIRGQPVPLPSSTPTSEKTEQ